jgi:tetratricopeptide (TPR) repeat protein/transcriptional regulator with XRE-family HTH domain
VAEQSGLSFAGLLRQLRAEARLTQEELAEAASLSPRSVSDLERGISRTAHKDTALLLAGALGLAGPVRELFVAAARGKAPAADVLAARQGLAPGPAAATATRTLPRDTASFTGRGAELTQLLGAIDGLDADGGVVGIHAIDGMAGIGKTTFAVHAAHRLAPSFSDGQFFLPLHAHTPGQRPVDPADALASLLLTAGVPAQQIPPGLEARSARWRNQVAGKKILLLLDDAAGHDQVRPLLPGTAGSLVLVTSRRRLTALDDAAVISLDTLSAGEAAALLVRLAGRPGLRAGDAAVGELTGLCGYLPLAIGMLARQLRHHPAWTPGELSASLAVARDRLALMHTENLSVGAAFGLSYTDLTPGQQRLFRRLGLVPGPDFDACAAAALDHTSLDEARLCLGDLYDQHLLTEPVPGRYQLHDLLREHARSLAILDPPDDSDEAISRLLDYYLHTAVTASNFIAARLPGVGVSLPSHAPACAPDIATSPQATAWLETERSNLLAAADYAATRNFPIHAAQIPAAMGDFLLAHGHWDQGIAVHQGAILSARKAGDRNGQARNLNHLGVIQRLTGGYRAAAASHRQALALFRDLGDTPGQGTALTELGLVQQLTGDYPAATASLNQALAIFGTLGDQDGQAFAHLHLGVVQRLTGNYTAAATTMARAAALFSGAGNVYGQASALNELGVVQRLTGQFAAAAVSFQQALEQFRNLGDIHGQACAINDQGVVQQLTEAFAAATVSFQQALEQFRDLGDRLGEAEALNNLGRLSFRCGDTQKSIDRHTQALAITREMSAPLEEARALEGIGYCHLQDGNPRQATPYLTQALAIYQRIGDPAAQRIEGIVKRRKLIPPKRPGVDKPSLG